MAGWLGTPRCSYSVPSSAMAFLFSGPFNAFSYFSCATRSSEPDCLNPKSSVWVAKVFGSPLYFSGQIFQHSCSGGSSKSGTDLCTLNFRTTLEVSWRSDRPYQVYAMPSCQRLLGV
eukprot:6476119-Amphidinium_carterae.1